MRIILPAQRFEHAKSRLADVWTRAERARNAQWMLERVLTSIKSCGAIGQTTVLSDDAEVRAVAEAHGAQAQKDHPKIQGHGAQLRAFGDALPADEALLILMSDLPLLDADALRAFLASCAAADVVLAPDRHDMGTNAAYFATHAHRRLHFGHEDSFLRHRGDLATNARLRIHRAPAFQYDLDAPEDLRVLQQRQQDHAPDDEELARCLWGSHA